jgi:hypothetical protein
VPLCSLPVESFNNRRPEQSELHRMMVSDGIFRHTAENVVLLNRHISDDRVVYLYSDKVWESVKAARENTLAAQGLKNTEKIATIIPRAFGPKKAQAKRGPKGKRKLPDLPFNLTEPPKPGSEEEEFVAQRLEFFRKGRVELRLPKAIKARGYAEMDKLFRGVLEKLWVIKSDSEDELLLVLAKNLKRVACK